VLHYTLIPSNPEEPYYFESTASEDTIKKKQIVYEDLISANTSAIDIIEKFVKKNRNFFFFLTYENQIAGLITFSELNNHQMKLAIFALICELETLLGRFISKNIADSQIKKYLKKDSLDSYENDKLDPLKNDRNVIEYFYLVDLLKIIGKEGLFNNLGYSSKTQFDRLDTLNELRKSVAHPIKSLVSKDNPVGKLWERIELTNDALFRLRQLC
jgi:hypothetical protein